MIGAGNDHYLVVERGVNCDQPKRRVLTLQNSHPTPMPAASEALVDRGGEPVRAQLPALGERIGPGLCEQQLRRSVVAVLGLHRRSDRLHHLLLLPHFVLQLRLHVRVLTATDKIVLARRNKANACANSISAHIESAQQMSLQPPVAGLLALCRIIQPLRGLQRPSHV